MIFKFALRYCIYDLTVNAVDAQRTTYASKTVNCVVTVTKTDATP